MKQNLSTKNIWEFTKDDTIYISKKSKSGDQVYTFLCQFERLVRNTVYGKILEIDSGRHHGSQNVGDVIYSDSKNCSLYGVSDRSTPYFHYFNTMGYAHKDIGTEKTEEVLRHPSFGLVGLSRRSGSISPLFGSNIQHSQTITLTIKRAENNRKLNNDFYHGIEDLIEIEMSGSQYAELVSSFNIGDGIPCTIRQLGRHSYPDPPYESPVDVFQREFETKMQNLGKECASLVEDSVKMLKDKPTINKADRDFLLNSIRKLIQEVTSNTPFVSQQFNESMEKTISQAKNEIETFVTNRITALGIDAVKDNPSLFLSGLNTETKNIDVK